MALTVVAAAAAAAALFLSAQATPSPSPKSPSAAAAAKLHTIRIQKIGDWELARHTRDAAGKQLAFCTAIVITGTEQALRVQFSPGTTVTWGFMGDGSGAVGKEPMVTYWFDGRRKDANTIRMRLIQSPEEDVEWLVYQQPEDAPDDDNYMNSRKVTFQYKWQGQTVNQVIPLKGSRAALSRLFESCQP